jgi:hypothetical protein
MTLVNIFEKIFNRLDAPTCFHIYMTIEGTQKAWALRDNPSIVQLVPTYFFYTPIITSGINWVSILALRGSIVEGTWVTIFA